MTRFARSSLILSLALLGASLQSHAQGNEAGKVLLSLGDVKVIRSAKEIPLKKGDPIQAGDVIVTGATSNAQLRMSDGAVIAIRAQTEFKINEYKFNGKEDGTERASLGLVKGGVRAVTGVIGRTNRDNLQVDGVVATVGVRGTGFNIVYCQGNCVNSDRSPAKNGLYANVFEGKVVVKNDATSGTYGVNEPVLIESKNSAISRLREIPVFMKDPLVGQVVVPKKAESVVVPVAAAVVVPKESAANIAPATPALATVTGVVVAVPPSVTGGGLPVIPEVFFNKTGMGEGQPIAAGPKTYYLQLAQTYPGSLNTSDGLPFYDYTATNNNSPPSWGVQVTGSGTTGYPNELTLYANPSSSTITQVPGYSTSGPSGNNVNNIYRLGSGSQVEGGTYNAIVSWGRWSGAIDKVGPYNDNNGPINYSSNSGFAYVIGTPTASGVLSGFLNSSKPSFTFNLIGATSPVSVAGQSGSTWYVSSGSLTANFAAAAINGNLAITTNQAAGFGLYNMTFNGTLGSGPSNNVTTSLVKQAGSLTTCATACAGQGNVSFYGTNAEAAGLSYGVNTGKDVIQGVAVFKR